MKINKDVSIDTSVEVDVEFNAEDVHAFIEQANTTEIAEIAKHIKDYLPGFTYQPTTIMEELAIKELEELINNKGAEAIVAILKQHQ